MLESIQVKNVALIDAAEVEFEKGLNILTGETGAGKSILLSSVQLALGAKADKSLIREGAEFASVTLTFLPNEEQKKRLFELDVECEEERLILQRRVYPNKSICKINGETVLLKTMQNVAELFIDIHGQREHQAVLKASVQEKMLDDYCAEELKEELAKLENLYGTYQQVQDQIEEAENNSDMSERELDLARFELDEIIKAELKPSEDSYLQERFDKLSNAQKIQESAGSTKALLTDPEHGALQGLSLAIHELSAVKDLDKELADTYSQISDAEMLLQDCGHALDRYLDRFDSEQKDLSDVTQRLNLINHLKDKYGNDIETVLSYADSLSDKLAHFENREQYLKDLKEKRDKAKAEYYETAKKLHKIREKKARELSDQMMTALRDLNFEQCTFLVSCEYDESLMKKNGCTRTVFQISLNKGEKLMELSSVASGGELSRIMLAFKSVFADKDRTGTLIFDEIDAGISGITAWKVSEKLAVLRKDHQVICITHLPQIAAMADVHFCIKKSFDEARTTTSVARLSDKDSISEVGRLLGSDTVTDAVLVNAAELKEKAGRVKASV